MSVSVCFDNALIQLAIGALCIVFRWSLILLPSRSNAMPPGSPLSIWLHLFCGAGHEKRRGEQLKWSLAFSLYIGNFPCAQLPGPVHAARLGQVFFSVFSLGLYFVYSFVFL